MSSNLVALTDVTASLLRMGGGAIPAYMDARLTRAIMQSVNLSHSDRRV